MSQFMRLRYLLHWQAKRSDEPAHLHSFAGAFTAHVHTMEVGKS